MTKKIKIDMLPDFESVRHENESIIWTGKPRFAPYCMTAFAQVIIGLVFLAFFRFISKYDSRLPTTFSALVIMIAVGIPLFHFFKKLLSYRNTGYALSGERVMFRTGILKAGFKVIDLDKILDCEVTINFFEDFYNVGTIKFFNGKTEMIEGSNDKVYDRWESIDHPYEIFARLKDPITIRPDSR